MSGSVHPIHSETKSIQPIITPDRLLGKVRKLKEGYGFIAGDDGRDYFFHWTAMMQNSADFRSLRVLDRVSFQIIRGGDRGDRAIEVSVVRDCTAL